jgi:uncharacterized phage-associated protein
MRGGDGMATVFDVGKYIVDKLGTVDTWKLQKLVYYCQAWSLVWDERPLFDSKIEAWANGPVCPDLYARHKRMYSIGPDSVAVWAGASPDALFETERETIDSVLEHYGGKPGHYLRELTHLEEPWIQARGDTPLMEPCNNEITHEMMRLYYGAL